MAVNMSDNPSFESLWNSHADFGQHQQDAEVPKICSYAKKFQEWATKLCSDATSSYHQVAINQAKIFLVDRYYEWRTVVPRDHRYYIGGARAGAHICIFQVFEDAYGQLRLAELGIDPPLLSLPAPPPPPEPPPPPPQIAGIFLGEKQGKGLDQ